MLQHAFSDSTVDSNSVLLIGRSNLVYQDCFGISGSSAGDGVESECGGSG
jgi:hypothetical protein